MNLQPNTNFSFAKRLSVFILIGSASIFLIRGIYALGVTQSSVERSFKVKQFKDLPLEVKVKNLQSKSWHKDIEIQVKNVSGRPIYFILAYLIFPDENMPAGDVGIRLTFGKRENVDLGRVAEPLDERLEPDESHTFTIPDPERKAFEGRHNKHRGLDNNLLLKFAVISFGDGTGFEAGKSRDYRQKKPLSLRSSITLFQKKSIR